MKRALVLLSLGLFLTSAPAALAVATPEEAQRLTALFQSYLGSEPGVVSVMPAGESYSAHIDFAPLLAKLQGMGVSASLTPMDMTLTDQGGGKWKVDQNQSFAFSFGMAGQGEVRFDIASMTGTGLFDEALGVLSSSSGEMHGISVEQTVTQNSQTIHTVYTIASATTSSAAQGTAERADSTIHYAFSDLHETMTVSAPPGGSAPPVEITSTAPSGIQDVTGKGLRMKGIRDLIQWFIAHPSKPAIIAGQAELKDRLRATLPLFDSMSGTGSVADLSVTTAVGRFAAKQADFALDMNGVVADGHLREAIDVTGLDLPPGLLPVWAGGLVPKKLRLDVSVTDFDLAAAAALILDNLDLTKQVPLPDELSPKLIQALLPSGSVTIGLGPSEILANLFDLNAEGSMMAGPASAPSGEALLKLQGLDETVAALQAGPPDVHQMAAGLLMAKNLGKAEPDGALSWKIEAKPAGAITVNGVDLTTRLNGGQ